MNREFLLNILFLISINLLIKPFYIFGIDRVIHNQVGDENYGLYFTLFNFTFLLQVINDFGIQVYNSRKISQNRELLKTYFSGIMMLKLLLASCYILAVFVIGYFNYDDPSYYPFLLWIGLIQILNSLLLYLRSNIAGLGWYRTDSIVSTLSKLLMILVCGVLLYTARFREAFVIEWFIYAQIGTQLITVFIAGWLIRKKVSWKKWHFDFPFILQIAKESYPYAMSFFLMTLYTRVDVVMLERMLTNGITEAGIYAKAYRLLDASNMIGFLFAGLLIPMFSRMLKESEPFRDLLRFSYQIIMSGALTVSITVFFFREEIMNLLYNVSSSYQGSVLGYLMLSFIPVCTIYIYSALLTANESLKQMNRLFAFGILFNITLNYFLIPNYQAAGAAIATTFTQSFIAFGLIFLSIKTFKLSWDPTLILKIGGFGLGVTSLAYVATSIIDAEWTVKFLATILLSILLALLFRLIHPKSLIDLVKTKTN